jgi:hypothetical protein
MVSQERAVDVDVGAGDEGRAVRNAVRNSVRDKEFLVKARGGRRSGLSAARVIGVLCLALSWTWSLRASAQDATNGDVATAIRTLEQAWYEAQARNDNGALDLIFDNDLVYIEYGRLIARGDYLLRVKSAKSQPAHVVMEASTVRTYGSAAIVVGSYRETGMSNGKAWQKRWRYVDTWVYKKGRWMLVAAAASAISK